MNKSNLAAQMFSAILLTVSSLQAQENSVLTGIKWNGYIQTDNRMQIDNNNSFSWQEYRLDLKAEVNPVEKAHFYSEIWLRSFQFPSVQNTTDLQDKDNTSPLGLDLREAYFDIYGFIDDDLDLRIGRQRIAWGKGDRLNPTDNLNADELEDIWDFGRHLGSDGITAKYYMSDFTLSGVYIPIFNPALLPAGQLASAMSSAMDLPGELSVGSSVESIQLPDNNFKDGVTAGMKLSNQIFNFDYSLSYVYGRDDFPALEGAIFKATSDPNIIGIETRLIYPRIQVAGVDFAGSVTDIGLWGEAGVFFPDKVKSTLDMSELGMGVQESVSVDNEPYIKYVIGADYTFKNGIYINGQYLHGFIHERGSDNLENYLMFGIEKKIMNDKIKIIPVSGGIEIKDFDDIKNNYGYVFAPEFYYYPVENTEIMLSIRIVDGKDTTMFGRIKNTDELCLKFNYSF